MTGGLSGAWAGASKSMGGWDLSSETCSLDSEQCFSREHSFTRTVASWYNDYKSVFSLRENTVGELIRYAIP